jgi:hypothetical protein
VQGMETRYAWLEVRPALKASQCSVDGCDRVVSSEIERGPFCVDHFIAAALREMESRSASLKEKDVDSSVISAFKQLLTSCSEQAQMLCQTQSSQYQPRLREVVRRATQMGKNLRRSPRVEACVPVWLRREDPRHTWEEETWTSTVSRHGAGFVCRHSVEINGTLILFRRDKGGRAEARVVYSRFDSEGRRHVGVELLNREDFWDLPKSAAPDTRTAMLPVSA